MLSLEALVNRAALLTCAKGIENNNQIFQQGYYPGYQIFLNTTREVKEERQDVQQRFLLGSEVSWMVINVVMLTSFVPVAAMMTESGWC
jgi:hypothetical protein